MARRSGCPACGGTEHSFLKTRRVWKCKEKTCHKQFSVKVGTIFEDSPIGLDKWLPAVWLVANSKNGISSHEAAHALGVTQKTAWFMLHRIRLAMQTGTFERMLDNDGDGFEADETFVGGRAKNMHPAVRERRHADQLLEDHRRWRSHAWRSGPCRGRARHDAA